MLRRPTCQQNGNDEILTRSCERVRKASGSLIILLNCFAAGLWTGGCDLSLSQISDAQMFSLITHS